MVYENTKQYAVLVNCSCKCGDGLEFRLELNPHPTDPYIWVSLVSSKWYAEQAAAFRYIIKSSKK